ncbi:MAG: hypothetical protein CMP68_02895 [Flavobacteriales bacterium]|nr:hypothetical protein [Flavobacteriales bacterium]|tara:strand:- start:34329 stop:36422 length:2094 start_codon:yes stop_codon:yes gene_type:complete
MKYLFFIFLFSFLNSQENYLVKIGNNEIFTPEFLNIYNKNRTDNDSLINSNEIDEYLDLFINFKLKVIEAESLGMDTLPSFKKELAGYRNQLSKSYLNDTKVTKGLLQEAYDRMKYEINASHILVSIDPTSSPEDTLKALRKINKIKNEFMNGVSFEKLASKYSDDPSVSKNDGNLGFFSALRMLYSFESAAYNTPIGQVSDPVRTSYGYHLLKVNDKRKTRGDVKVAHIMIVNDKKSKSDTLAKEKIFEIYSLLSEGEDFSDLAKKYSDDKKSGSRGGELDWFGVTNKVNMYETFSNASFDLVNIGDISKPIKTPAGWHIIKLLQKKDLPPYSEIESTLKSRIEKDSRSQKSRNALVKRCKDFYDFREFKKYLKTFYDLESEKILKAKGPQELLSKNDKKLFSLTYNDKIKNFTQNDFLVFLMNFKNSFRNKENSSTIIDELYRMFIEQSIINFENNNLESRYSEFAMLMDEYHDGILLFDLMNEMVWSKAVNDTVGLNSFYSSLITTNPSSNFFHPERVVIKVYETYDEKTHKKLIKQFNRGYDDEYLISRFNKDSNLNLKIYEEVIPLVESAKIKETYNDSSKYYFNIKKDTLKKSIKELDLIKGLVISEYQNLLEKEWLSTLKEKYKIYVNYDILKLIKENKINQINQESNNEEIKIPEFFGTFSNAYKKAVKTLGSSKKTYFKWKGNTYTTE